MGSNPTPRTFFRSVLLRSKSAQSSSRLRRLSNLACLFSLRSKIHAQSSSRFASLEPRTFFTSYHSFKRMLHLRVVFDASRTSYVFRSVYFASLMQRKYLAEFLELKKSQRLIFSTISFNASQARYAVLSIVSGVSVTYPSMIPWTSVPCSFRWTTSPQIQ